MNDAAPQRMMTVREAAVSFYNQAITLAQKGTDQDKTLAYRLFCSAVELDPSFNQAWFNIGVANTDMHLGEAAIGAFRRAIEIAPKDDNAWVNLGHQLYHLGRLDEGRDATMQALGINKDNHLALCNLSIIDQTQGNVKAAIEHARRAFELAPSIPVIEFTLAMALLHDRQWIEGMKHFESRFAYAKQMQHFLSYPYPRWSGESLDGRTLYLIADQGMGDTISMFRFFGMLNKKAANGHVIAHVQPDLMRLCTLLFANLKRITFMPMNQPFPAADWWISCTSLPNAMGVTQEEFETAKQPTVPALPSPVAPTWKAQGRRLHVGVAWAGSADNAIDRWRSFRVQELLELYECPGIQLYSLQMGPPKEALHAYGCASTIRDLSPFIRDVVDTLSLMRDLDLIISVESSPAHMAGLLGIDCWVPYSYNGSDWRFGQGDKGVLWCPRHRIFKQGPDAQWLPVFKRIAAALKQRIGV